MRYLVISCSYNPASRSRALAEITFEHLQRHAPSSEFVNLPGLNLPLCDGGAAYGAPGVSEIGKKIEQARGIILAAPIYNYDLNAATKNLLEMTGRAWSDKVVGFICAAGGHGSYMSVMPFANSLMLDFRCLIIPRFIYAPPAESSDEMFGDLALGKRADELARDLVRITEAVHPAR